MIKKHLQVLEITDRAVICLNLMDEAERHHLVIDDRCLARDLGVPVVPAVARQGKGISLLIQMVAEVAIGEITCKPHRIKSESPVLKRAIQSLVEKLQVAFPGLPNARWVALHLLEGDSRMEEAVRSGELGNLVSRLAVPKLETLSEVVT